MYFQLQRSSGMTFLQEFGWGCDPARVKRADPGLSRLRLKLEIILTPGCVSPWLP